MTERFNRFAPFIIEWETEYAKDGSVRVEHDKDDPGGTTAFGIDQRSHPGVDIEHLTKDHAIAIYFEEWWTASCETMADKLGEVYFNCVVNCGTGRARKLLALADNDASEFINEQAAFYKRLVAARPSSSKYLKGWLNRLAALRKQLSL